MTFLGGVLLQIQFYGNDSTTSLVGMLIDVQNFQKWAIVPVFSQLLLGFLSSKRLEA
jgi:hypothetical protein